MVSASLRRSDATSATPMEGPTTPKGISSSSSSSSSSPRRHANNNIKSSGVRTSTSGFSVKMLILTNLLVFQLTWYSGSNYFSSSSSSSVSINSGMSSVEDWQRIIDQRLYAVLENRTSHPSTNNNDPLQHPLLIPQGHAVALPSIRIDDATENTTNNSNASSVMTIRRGAIYGGDGDKAHLGGWTDMDHHGVSPETWKWMITTMGVHSVLDIGCGRGISTTFFLFHHVDVLCVEGSHDALDHTVLPNPSTTMIEHDFSRGPWWPDQTYDAVWCIEFLEHVGRNFHANYLIAMRKAALIFASHSGWGGHHHVEVHDEPWWIEKFTMYGFVYSPALTKQVRSVASKERQKGMPLPNGVKTNAQHIWLTLKVFINPSVAALPRHAHLMAEPGCFIDHREGIRYNRECGHHPDPKQDREAYHLESTLPPRYKALPINESMHAAWFEHIQPRVTQVNEP